MKKTLLYSLGLLLIAILTIGVTYAYFINTVSSSQNAEANAKKFEVLYTGGSALTTNLQPRESRDETYKTSVNIKMAEGSINAIANIYINIEEMSDVLASDALVWEIVVKKGTNNINITPSKGTFSSCMTNSINECNNGRKIYILNDYIAARAQLVTFILFIWELYFIEKFIENRKIRYAIGLVIIATPIANLHCAVWPFFFVIFLPYVAEYIIAVIADSIIYNKSRIAAIKHKMKVAQKKNNLERLKELQVKLDEQLAKNEKIKAKREIWCVIRES